jgi:hypothetical protein
MSTPIQPQPDPIEGPEPAEPQPAVPQPAVPQPTVPQPTVPQPTAASPVAQPTQQAAQPVPWAPRPEPPRPQRRPSLATPLILVILGLLFLLSNFGMIDQNIWELFWRLWPLWLVAVGIDLLLGRRPAWGTWIGIGFLVLVLGGGYWAHNSFLNPANGDTVVSEQWVQPLGTARKALITLRTGVGTFDLQALPPGSQDLAAYTIAHSDREEITRDASTSGDTLYFTLRSRTPAGAVSGQEDHWDLKLAPDVPLDLRLDVGVSTTTLDLSGLAVTNLELKSGVGRTTVTMPDQGKVTAHIESGVSSVRIYLPRSMAYRIQAQTGVGRVEVNGERIRGSAVSTDFERAANSLDLTVQAGVGSVELEQR